MIEHHPDDALLLDHVAGSLPAGPRVVVASHVEQCARCQASVQLLEAAGGALVASLQPSPLQTGALATALAAIERSAAVRPASPPVRPASFPDLPKGASWPRALTGCPATRWRWLGPGIRWSRVTLPYDRAANVFLLRIAAGVALPSHSHGTRELTQVLHGAFDDGRAVFAAGDFDEADDAIHHQPNVLASGECICLASVEGKVRFDGTIARVLGSLVGM